MVGAAEGLSRLSAERVRDEWFKGLSTAQLITDLVRLWRESGAADRLLPELDEVAAKTLARADAVDRGQRDPVLLTALLVPDAAGLFRRLKASGAEIDRAAALMSGPSAPTGEGDVAVRRWLSATGKAADDLLAMWAMRNGVEPPWASTARTIKERGDPLTRGDLAIGGSDLQALGMKGPRIGEILATLLDLVLEDPGRNSRETLVTLARSMA
jgi:tRNA nucleotidyltransferase/poly(A) polymerase